MLWLSVGLAVGFTSGYLAAPDHAANAKQNVSTGGGSPSAESPPSASSPPPVVTVPEPEPVPTVRADVASGNQLEPDVPPPSLSAYQRSTIKLFPPMDRTRDNGVTFARMGIGEVGRVLWPNDAGTNGEPTADHLAMLQTIRNLMDWKALSLSDAMELAAPHITGAMVPVKTRQWWLSTMPSTGDHEPSAGWHECGRKRNKPCGDWPGLYADNWVRFREWAIQRVVHGYWDECPGEPRAYGCRPRNGCNDDAFAIKRGLCLLDCGSGEIGFWARPGDGCESDDPLTVDARTLSERWCLDNPEAQVCS